MSIVGEERKRHILNVLEVKGKVKVGSLAKELQVSTETIRRHLEELESEKKLRKVYGGAIKISFEKEEPPHFKRAEYYSKEKNLIGKKAAELVNDNEIILIDVGTTTIQMIKYLEGRKNLTILTTSIPALNMLVGCINKGSFTGKIIFTGGEINTKQWTVSGGISEKFIDSFYLDKSFISPGGLCLDNGVTAYEVNEALLSTKIMKNSKEAIILSDHSKLGVRNYIKISDLDDVDIIVCDTEPPHEWKKELEEKDITWIVAE